MNKIVIVGCGIVGATIAYELSLIPQLEIVVIEQNTFASGATGAALGLLMGAISGKTKGRAWRLRETSLKRYQSLIPELEAKTSLKIPVNRDGMVKLLFAGDKLEKWQKLQQTRKTQGWDLEIWDCDRLKQKCPQINCDNLIGAVYSPQDTQINPQILTEALVKAASLNGVEFQFGVSLTNIENKKITTTQGDSEIDRVIIAAGLGATPLTASLQEKLDIRPVLGQAIKFSLDSDLGLADFQPVVTGNDIHIVPLGDRITSLRDREYWLGATVEFPNEDSNVVADRELLVEVKEKAIAFCPQIANATILQSWQGKRPRPYGQPAPIIRKLEGYDNILLATAHYRNGVLLAPGTALEIKNLLAEMS